MTTTHLDEARRAATEELERLLGTDATLERAILIDDIFGKLRAVLWGPKAQAEVQSQECTTRLTAVAGHYWSGDVWHAGSASRSDHVVYEQLWKDARPISKQLRLADRLRNRTAWFIPTTTQPWNNPGTKGRPPIIVFYSFKGGVGRTTTLMSFALQRARAGERIAVIDFDLDAPGLGTTLAADARGTTAEWGVVDYLLEQPLGTVELRDYYHACRRSEVTGSGEILVIPAGSLRPNREYLGKLARIDLEPSPAQPAPLSALLMQVKSELDPDWICIDARAGLSEPAGVLLSGVAHLHVLLGTSSDQSWRGIELVLGRIGAARIQSDKAQLDCLLIHAMVPEDTTASKLAKESFNARADESFRSLYYAEDPADPDEERFWYLRDSESSDAPHVPLPVTYQPKLAHYAAIDDVADHLATAPELVAIGERITMRFTEENFDEET